MKVLIEWVLVDGDNMIEVWNYLILIYVSLNFEYFGKGKGMNVIYIYLELF